MPSNQECELKKVMWLGIVTEINVLFFLKSILVVEIYPIKMHKLELFF